MHVDQLTNSGGAKSGGASWARPRPIIWSKRTSRGLLHCERRECSRCCCRARFMRWERPLSARAGNDRGGPGGRAGDGFQSRLVANAIDADGACRSPCTQMKMTPAEAITAATINAAYSLNRGDKIGSLEAGQAGELCRSSIAQIIARSRIGSAFRRRIPFTSAANACPDSALRYAHRTHSARLSARCKLLRARIARR